MLNNKNIKIAIFSIFILIMCIISGTNSLSRFENFFNDFLIKNSGEASVDVVIIGIDDESIEQIGRYPWDRGVHAQLLNTLAEGDAAVIGMDLVFSEPSEDPYQDVLFAEAIENAGNVILPVVCDVAPYLKDNKEFISLNTTKPIDVLLDKALDVAHIYTNADKDRVIRRAVPYIYDKESGEYYTSFNYKVYEIYAEKNNLPKYEFSANYFDRPVINFAGLPGTIEIIPYYAAMDKDIIDPSYFENKIVLIGDCAQGTTDIYYTAASLQASMYGVEIHANFINNLILDNYKLPILNSTFVIPNTQISISVSNIVLTLIFALICIFVLNKLKVFSKKMMAILLSIVGYIIIYYIVFKMGYLIQMIYPVITLFLLLILDLIFDYQDEQLNRKHITDVFGRYMAKEVIGKIIEEGEENLKLGGIKKDITIMFVDIRGFTTLSEKLPPEEVVDILNEYLSMGTEKIFECKGVLDKYIGDAIMALFNVPYDLEDHELMAVKSAILMRNDSDIIYEKFLEKYGKGVRFGIGINKGEAIVGNIGSESRMDYTAIGDDVNLASRLESNAKPGQILISESVYEKVKDHVEANCIGELAVKGRTSTVLTYEVISLK